MRKIIDIFLGCAGLLNILALYIVSFVNGSGISHQSFGVWDYLGIISLSFFLIGAVIVFLRMIFQKDGKNNLNQKEINFVALISWPLIILFAYLSVVGHVSDSAPLPQIENFLMTGFLLVCPAIVAFDLIRK